MKRVSCLWRWIQNKNSEIIVDKFIKSNKSHRRREKVKSVETIAMAEIDQNITDEVAEIDQNTTEEVGIIIRKYFSTFNFVTWQGTETDTAASTSASVKDSSEVIFRNSKIFLNIISKIFY